jgi:hypothetical protein
MSLAERIVFVLSVWASTVFVSYRLNKAGITRITWSWRREIVTIGILNLFVLWLILHFDKNFFN